MPQLNYDYDYLPNYGVNRKYYNSNKKKYTQQPVQNKVKKRTFDYESQEKSFFELEREYRQKKSFDFDMEKINYYSEALKNKPEEISLEETDEVIEEQDLEKQEAKERHFKYFKRGFAFAIIAVISLFICYRYSLINEKFNSVEKAKKELLNAQTVNEQIQADIDSETDISYIENYAKYQLGMQKPQDSQIMYINVEKQDKIFAPVKIEDEKEKTWFGEFMEKLANMF